MNRRGFFKGLAVAALCATTRLYSLAAAPIVEQAPLTLAEWAAKSDSIPDIVNLLRQTNEILSDMVFRDAGPATPHRVTIRTELPQISARDQRLLAEMED